MLSGIYFNHPHALWLMVALPALALVGWFTRSGLRPIARVTVTVIRCLALIAGIIALADPVSEAPAHPNVPRTFYILQDRSLSMGGDPAADVAARTLPGLVGMQAEKFYFSDAIWRPDQSPRSRDQTDIATALDSLADQIGESTGSHIVLITDGRSTRGLPTDAATRFALRGNKIDVLPAGLHHYTPAHFVEVNPPLNTRVGISSSIRVTLSSDLGPAATIKLFDSNHRELQEREIPMPGEPTLMLPFDPHEDGLRNYLVQAEVGGQIVDQRQVPIYVQGPPRILLVDNVPEEAGPLAKALSPLNMPVDLITADKWPSDLTPYAAVIVSDLAGDELTPDQRGSLRDFVESQGSGLIFIGGSNVIAARWNENPLHDLLPIRLKENPPTKVKQKLPDISVAFVLDQSGSMNEALPGSSVSKLEMVKAAAIASMQSMPESARLAVIAFEWQPHVVVPPTPITQRQDIATKIDSIACGGGTVMYPAIQKGLETLHNMGGDKYLIVLTDGDSAPPPDGDQWSNLSFQALKDGVSWTSIGVGSDADQNLLRNLATGAGGRYAYCNTVDQIPKVFIDRAKAIRRNTQAVQTAFSPIVGPDLSDLRSLSSTKFPSLLGSNLAEILPGSRTLLLTDKRNPLLTSWQFGAGKVFAFTSDAKNLWAKSWLASPIFSKFWTTLVSSVARPHEPMHATEKTISQGNHFVLAYHVRSANGEIAENLAAHVSVQPPIPQAPEVSTPQPGEYKITLDLPSDDQSHSVDVTLQSAAQGTIHHRAILTAPKSAELSATGPDWQSCQEIAAAGNGICSADPSVIAAAIRSEPPNQSFLRRTSLWPWFVAIMLILWPVDVLLRKVL
ncbi:MAG TPA: VWA domain-containing protein [Tepidisphaeraceae bacterium]|jgi:Mg-chelatase subunit ChlD